MGVDETARPPGSLRGGKERDPSLTLGKHPGPELRVERKARGPQGTWQSASDSQTEWPASPSAPTRLPQQWRLLQTFCPRPSPTCSMHSNEAPQWGVGVAAPIVICHTGGASLGPGMGGLRGEVKISAAQRDDYGAAPKLSCFTAGTWACVGIIVLEYLMLDWLGCFVFDHILKCDLTVGVGN